MDIEQQRRALEGMRTRLEGRSTADYQESLRDYAHELSVFDNHPADVASEDYLRNLEASFRENDRCLLGEIDQALARLDRGEYGGCMECGKKIDPQRLEALPYARTCRQCAEIKRGDPGFSHQTPFRGEFTWPTFQSYGTSGGDSEAPPPDWE